MNNYIYNVLVSGFSVGLTESLQTALEWKKESFSNDVKIIKVPYHVY